MSLAPAALSGPARCSRKMRGGRSLELSATSSRRGANSSAEHLVPLRGEQRKIVTLSTRRPTSLRRSELVGGTVIASSASACRWRWPSDAIEPRACAHRERKTTIRRAADPG